eukprot:TRINITY_DN32623_c0_g1_i1.p1 TRINITY_DN32623_c0_g1~~TRINITY_DN32623_c0_g1_i1.p1  ORF type:complete len:406 (-),score=96.07 TRINITY_DN32623_c0_g1_i1:132-1349(-)
MPLVLSLDETLALQDELITAYKAEDLQRRLKLWAKTEKLAGAPSALAATEEREAALLEIQMPIVAKYGFEASAKGVMEAMRYYARKEFSAWNQVIKRNNWMEMVLQAGEPLDNYNHVWMQQEVRNQGYYRPIPETRYPLIQTSTNAHFPEGIIKPVPRTDMLSADATEELLAACKRSDVAKASSLLGARKVGSSAKAVAVNIGYKSLGVAGAKTLGKALSSDLEVLELDVSGNCIGPEGAKALASGLPPRLRVLKLNIANNRIMQDGANAIFNMIPKSAEVLSMGLAGMKIGTEGAIALAEKIPPGVRDLTLDLFGNGVGDAGIEAISKALPKTLEFFHVVLQENALGRRGFFMFDRQVGDPLHEHHLPNLTPAKFIKAGGIELPEFSIDQDGVVTRQIDFKKDF